MKPCVRRWYLKGILLIANDVVDFYTHVVLLYDHRTQEFTQHWHLLGVKEDRLRGRSRPLTPRRAGIRLVAGFRRLRGDGLGLSAE